MATFTWEQAIKVLLPDTNTLTTREAATSEKWVSQDTVHVEIVTGDGTSLAAKYDVSHIIPLTHGENPHGWSDLSCVIGFNLDWKNVLDNTQSKYNLFQADSRRAIGNLLFSSTHSSGAVSLPSFDSAADVIHGAHSWLAKWVPILKRWEEGVDADESEWKGSAAGAFRKFLDIVHIEMSKVQLDLAQPIPAADATGYPDTFDFSGKSGYEKLIADAKQQLSTSLLGMYNALDQWWWPPGSQEMGHDASPVWRMRDAFEAVMSSATCTFTWRYQSAGNNGTGYYYPENPKVVDNSGSDVTQKFWLDGVEIAAKKTWLEKLKTLDDAAQKYMSALDTAYLALGGSLREGVYQPRFQMPTGGGAGPDPEAPPGKGGGGTGGGAGDIEGIGKGGSDGDGGIGGGTGGGTGGPKSGLPDFLPGSGKGGGPGYQPPSTLPGSGSSGGGAPLLDKNGKPVLGADGQPVLLPPGSRIGKDGKVYDKNGKPVLGSNGKQVVAPPGAKVGQPQPTPDDLPGKGLPGSNYDQILLPEDAKILPDGTVVDAKGKPVLDSNGNPYALPKGATIKDGVVVDANGKPLSRAYQLLTNSEHALNSRPTPHTTTSGGPAGTDGRLLDHFGRGSGGTGSGSKNFTGSGTGGTTLFGDRAARSAGLPETAAGATASAGGTHASGGTGGGTQSAYPPMMPPMNPGAAGGAQPNQGKDRQRTTWLTEDEDTWGTDTGSVSGVIGR
jgi:hypothetical protein